jgi:hypothetical protein
MERTKRSSGGRDGLPTKDDYLKHYRQQIGRGSSNPFGQIYAGRRFVRQQHGGGIGTFLSSVVRGITGLLGRTPPWLKTGAKIVGKAAMKNIGDYRDDVNAGVNKSAARKRAFRSTVADIADEVGKVARGGGCRKKRKKLAPGGGGGRGGRRHHCCKVKILSGSGRKKSKHNFKLMNTRKKMGSTKQKKKTIKGRTKFDLLSL